ncbi:C40 family peptidase [Nitrospirillum pindoramense]|uniref:NlpC/P60 family protein n=1 Tax=Nitrospirillum amazonense TaxID=28077 RepID=A0A560H641_9PROT|nr:NlpC/P60 family protein [Nitrospirillum amazonense]TWB41763.1 NlpC/P60 family protein [Nitrospirillum amazonense]
MSSKSKSTPAPKAALDPRVNPYRSDLASAHLYGKVTADRYVDGVPCQVRAGYVSLKEEPTFTARQSSQLLFGEVFTVFEEKDGWVWGQNATDGYVGYLQLEALDDELAEPTHKLTALRSFFHPEPDLKTPPLDMISLGAPLCVVEEADGFAGVAGGGWVPLVHVAEIGAVTADPVETALRLLGTPYLWGGRTSVGIDCSGLIQLALDAAGLPCPRDSDQQQVALGTLVSADGVGHAYQRGDLVFFPGHVGIMADETHLVHANAHHMATVREPLADVLARAAAGKGVTAVKRLR